MSTETKELNATNVLNGVDVSQVLSAVNAFKDNEELAGFRFHITNRWIEGGYSRSKVKSFFGAGRENEHNKQFDIDCDAHTLMAGKNRGATPPEHFLNALASCVTTTLVYQAAVNGIEIEELESEIEGYMDMRGTMGIADDIRKGYESIKVSYKVKTDSENLKTLEEIVNNSPMLDVTKNGTNVDVFIEGM